MRRFLTRFAAIWLAILLSALVWLAGHHSSASSISTSSSGNIVHRAVSGDNAVARAVVGAKDSTVASLLATLALPDQKPQSVAAIFTVTNGNDSGAGSLRNMIAAAAAGDIILFSGVTTVTLTSGQLTIDKDLTIDGGASGVTITRSGATQFRIFNIPGGITATLNKLTISNGNPGSNQAGGIQNSGTLTMTDCTVSGNTSIQGGGIQNDSVLTLTNCTVSGNTSTGTGGGFAMFGTTTTLTNCTVSGNTASGGGGGGFSISSGTLNLTNCTVANNTAQDGGAMTLSGSTHVFKNTIVAGNTATVTSSENIIGTVSSTSSYNLIGVGGTGGLTDGVNGNQVGVANPLLNSLANNGGYTQTISLQLGSPALDKGAAATGVTTDQRGQPRPYDAANIAPAAGGNNSDIGAYEENPTCSTVTVDPGSLPNGTVGLPYSQTITATGGTAPYTFVITSGSLPAGLMLASNGTLSGIPTTTGTSNFTVTAAYGFGCSGSRAYSITIGSCSANTTYTVNDTGDAADAAPGDGACQTSGGVCTLRAAIQEINALPACANTINFSVTGTINLSSALPDLAASFTFNGPGANLLTVRRNTGTYRIFNIPFNAAANISGLTLSNGRNDEGGAIRNAGSLTVTNCALTGNQSKGTDAGGAAGKTGGGGAIFNDTTGVATITRSIFTSNTATGGNGEFANGGGGGGGGLGGALFNNGGTLTVTNSTITGNTATGGNGGNANTLCPSGAGGKGGGKGGQLGSVGGFGGGGSGGANSSYGPAAGGRFGGAGGAGAGQSCVSSAGTGGSAAGGALFNYGGTSTLVNVTLVSNTVTAGNNGAAASRGGGIYNETGTVTIKNSIVAGNSAQTAGTEDCDNNSAPITTSGYNLFGSGTGCPTGGTQDQTVAAANLFTTVLGPLGYYGGTTQTYRLLAGSPVIDKGSAHTGITVDQRNATRPVDQPGVSSAPGGNASDIGAFEAQICPSVTIAPTSLANIDVGTSFNQTFTGSGGTSPYTFAVTAGTLPTGLTLTLAGVLSGTPTALGTYNFTITMSDDNGCVATQAFTTNVVCPTITIDPASLPDSVQGATYSQTFTATGGTGTISWSRTAGTLPGGLTLNSSGVLSGTPNASGTFTFTITATRQFGCTGSREYTVIINPCVNAFTVNNLGDAPDAAPGDGVCETATGNGVCTLRAAIQEANALPGCAPHSITVSGGGTIDLATALPDLNANMTINGPGASSLTVRRSTVAGTPDFTVFTIGSNRTVTLNGLTISNGRNSIGAGVRNNGILTVESCVITGNTAYSLGNGFSALSRGGGIFQSGSSTSLTLSNSTVSGNQSIAETTDTNGADAQGGGIQRSSGAITIINSTISGNTAQSITPSATSGTARGGGFYLSSNGTLTVTNATISNNSATGGDTANEGGGVFRDPAATGAANFKNAIIAGNDAATGPDISGTMVSQGFNLIGKSDGGAGFTDGTNNDLVGSLASPRNALLAALGSYGGATLTHALLPGSPAINAGTSTGAPATDQRGVERPQQSALDIGAFESRGFTLAVNAGNNQSATINANFASSLIVSVSSVNGEPVNGGQIIFTVPGSGASCTVAGNPATVASGLASTGTVTANGTVGGPYAVSANANGATAGVNFSLTNNALNTAPSFTSVETPSRQKGSPASNSQIATVTDSQTAPGSLTVTITSANPSNGVTVSNIVNSNGTIMADIVAACEATNASFILQVSDGSLMATATLNVTVNDNTAPMLGNYATTSVNTFGGTTVTPDATPTDNGIITSLTAMASPGTFTGTLAGNPSTGVITVSNAAPAGSYTITVTAMDNCGATATKTFTLNVTCQNYTVNSLADTNTGTGTSGTLRYCINQANTQACPTTITFSVTGTITLTNSLPTITTDLTINGPGPKAGNLIIQGNNTFLLMKAAAPGVDLTISKLSFTRGRPNSSTAGALEFTNGGVPGNAGVLTVTDSEFYDNQGVQTNGDFVIYASNATGVALNRCTVRDNGTSGIKIDLAPLTVTSSTFHNNNGTAIYNISQGSVVSHTTITNHLVGIWNDSSVQPVSATLTNNLLSNNGNFNLRKAPTTFSNIFTSGGHNLIDDDKGNVFLTNPQPTDILNQGSAQGGLAPIGDYGGATQTRALFCTSQAFNAGPTSGVPATDQRGLMRMAGAAADIGAYEANTTVTINQMSLPPGSIGSAYNQALTVTGGMAPYNFLAGNGNLPAGLSLSSAGVLSGLPTANGSYTFSVLVVDANGEQGCRTYTVLVCPTIIVNPSSLPNGTTGVAYGTSLSAAGGTSPYSFTVTGGSLPAGLTLNSNGTWSGVPTTPGMSSFTVTATDANGCTAMKAYTLTINCPVIVINPSSLPNGTTGVAYTTNITASGGVAPYMFSVTAGSVPTGLTLNSNGTWTGTPTAANTFNFTVTATDANGCTAMKIYNLTINCATITVNPTSLPAGTAGTAYPTNITASGGAAPHTFTVTAGTAPTGLTLNSNGTWSGAPTTNGTFTFTVTATDSNNCTGSRGYSLTINCPAITVNPASLPAATVGIPYNQTVSATPATTYTFAVTLGALPTGLMLDSNTGAITGTPTASGTANFTITATGFGTCTGSRAYTLVIDPAAPTLGNYANTTVALSGNATVTPSVAPTDAARITVATSTGFKGTLTANPISGALRVTNAHPAGTYNVMVKAFNSVGVMTTKSFSLTVPPGVECATPTFADAPDVNVGGSPASVAVGDFNGDGKQDFAVANSGTDNVSVRLGDGAGGFTNAANVGAGDNPASVAVGDFNGDGRQDIAVANFGSHTVSIRLGDGAGNFTGSLNVGVGTNPQALVVGDFNNDGYQDIAAASSGTDAVSVRLGDGAGNFTGSIEVSVGDNPQALVVGDFNEDNHQDLATANTGPDNLSIRFGDGAGNFTGSLSIGVGDAPQSLAVGDFNNDGKQDLAVANNAGTPNVSIRLGDGTGNFTNAADVSVGVNPRFIAAGDFDNDGNQDLAVSISSGTGSVAVRFGDGAGNFSGSLGVPVDLAAAIAVGDFNGDGKQDFASAGIFADRLSVRLGGCNAAPTITAAAALTRQQDSAGISTTIATVNDAETPRTGLVVTATTVPAGITVTSISAPNATTGEVTATVAADCTATAGANTVVLTVTDGDGSTAMANLTVNVTANTPPTLTYANQSVTAGGSLTVDPATGPADNGSIDSIVVQSQGNYTGTVAVNDSTGVVSLSNAGPSGTHTITIQITDNCGATTDATFTVNVGCQTITVTPPAVNMGTIGALFNQTFTQSGGIGTVTFTTASTLPNGITLAANGTLSGTPMQIGSFPIVVTATDANNCTATASYTLTINCQAITVTAPMINTGTVGMAFSQTFTQTGAIGMATFTTANALPNGVTLSSGGILSGTPMQPGSFPITVKVTDANGCMGTVSYTLTIGCPSTFIVNNLGDTPDANVGDGIAADASGNTTLRAAIMEANALAACSPLTINFSGALALPGSITLGSALPPIIHPNLTINGPGANRLTINANGAVTGARVLSLSGAVNLTVSGLTLSNGRAAQGAGIGLLTDSAGTLTLNDCALTNNIATDKGGAIHAAKQWTVNVNRCAFSGNSANEGGALSFDNSMVNVTNSTLSSNMATTNGGAVRYTGSSTALSEVTLLNSTVANNSAGTAGGGLSNSEVTLKNTVVAGNVAPSAPDALGAYTSLGNNLIGKSNGSSGWVGNDLTGSVATPLDAQLAPLGNYGGPTQTHAVCATSPAANAGNNTGAPATDQRGLMRPVNDTVDMGAFEANIVVNPASIPVGLLNTAYTATTFTATGGSAPYVFSLNGTLPAGMNFTGDTLSGTPTETGSFSIIVIATGVNGFAGASCYTLQICGAITCPTNITTSTDPNQCGALVNFPTQTMNGACGTVMCSPPSGSVFPKGTTTVTCTASGSGATCSFTVSVNDTQDPVFVACTPNIVKSTDTDECTATVTYTPPVATDNCTPAPTVSCLPASGSTFNKGVTTVTCTATDSSERTATCTFTVTVNDTQNPTISCPANVILTAPAGGATVTYKEPTVGDNCAGVGSPVCTPPSGSTFAIGTTTVTCEVVDAAENESSCSFTVTVNLDCTISCPPNQMANTTNGQCGAQVNYPLPTTTGGCGTVTCTPPAGSVFVVGTTTVNCATTAGPACSFTVTVNDVTPPTILCPANIVKPTDANQCSAVVTYMTPQATDNCAGVGAVTCTPPSGSVFPKGVTAVTCMARDASNNQGVCAFTVTVNDTQVPTLNCPASQTLVTPNPGDKTLVVTFAAPAAADNCAVATVVCNPATGTTFPVGATSVNCTATDTSGNTAQCSFTVTVYDVRLQDDTTPGNVLLFNSTTGDYSFCYNGSRMTGRGTVNQQGGNITLTHNTSDRRVTASCAAALKRGNASLQAPPGSVVATITDRNTANNTSICAAP